MNHRGAWDLQVLSKQDLAARGPGERQRRDSEPFPCSPMCLLVGGRNMADPVLAVLQYSPLPPHLSHTPCPGTFPFTEFEYSKSHQDDICLGGGAFN